MMWVLFIAWYVSCQLGEVHTSVPVEYSRCDTINVSALPLTSTRTLVPYNYYHLPFCQPNHLEQSYQTVNTPYQFNVLENESCTIVCQRELSVAEQKLIYQSILDDYYVHLAIDEISVLYPIAPGSDYYEIGYLPGWRLANSSSFLLYNHLEFTVKYHYTNGRYRIIRFEVVPKSLQSDELLEANEECRGCCTLNTITQQTCKRPPGKANDDFEFMKLSADPSGPLAVNFTYSLVWEPTDVEWNSRWDTYLPNFPARRHWLLTVFSFGVVFCLCIPAACIFRKSYKYRAASLKKHKNKQETSPEQHESVIDLLISPQHLSLFCALIGTGVQLISFTFLMILDALIAYQFLTQRPDFLEQCWVAGGVIYVLVGILAGFSAGRLYKTLGGQNWKKTALLTGCLYPSIIIYSAVLAVTCLLLSVKSSATLSLTTILTILVVWLLLYAPLVYYGFYLGYSSTSLLSATTTSVLHVCVRRRWYQTPLPIALLAGIVSFGVIFIELSLAYLALWRGRFYPTYGFLLLNFLFLVVTSSLVALNVIYFQLRSQDYYWCWKSFLANSGTGIYVLIFSGICFADGSYYYGVVGPVIYWTYCVLISVTLSIVTGTIGFYTAYTYIIYMYKSADLKSSIEHSSLTITADAKHPETNQSDNSSMEEKVIDGEKKGDSDDVPRVH